MGGHHYQSLVRLGLGGWIGERQPRILPILRQILKDIASAFRSILQVALRGRLHWIGSTAPLGNDEGVGGNPFESPYWIELRGQFDGALVRFFGRHFNRTLSTSRQENPQKMSPVLWSSARLISKKRRRKRRRRGEREREGAVVVVVVVVVVAG